MNATLMDYFKKAVSSLLASIGYQVIKINDKGTPNESTVQDKEFFLVSQLPGFLDRDAYDLFRKLSSFYQEKTPAILEIGIFCGRSFLALGLAFETPSAVVGIDPFYEDFKNSPALEEEGKYLEQASNYLSRNQRLVLLKKTLAESDKLRRGLATKFDVREIEQDEFFETRQASEKFHIVHIDGEHSFQAVYNFLDHAQDTLNPNALVIVDDFLNPGFPVISEAVHTHPTFKRELFPIIYAFNKAVFFYKPVDGQPKALAGMLAQSYRQENRIVRHLGDDSVVVQ
jgi:hypothetical protein